MTFVDQVEPKKIENPSLKEHMSLEKQEERI